MAARATWKGVLQISRVRIPIKVFPATSESDKLSFNQLHSVCVTRLEQRRWCHACSREIPTSEIVKGYEFSTGKYVLLLPEELDAIAPPSTRVIDLTRFADASALQPYSIERSYYLAPDGPPANEAFAVLRIAMRHRVGIGKLAIYGREYLVAVGPTLVPASATPQVVLMLHTLHHAAELRSAEAIDELQTGTQAPVDQVTLAQQVIAALMGPLDLGNFTDQYQTDLGRLIEAKITGHEFVVPVLEEAPVLTLRAALEQSLAVMSASKKISAKGTTPRKRRAS